MPAKSRRQQKFLFARFGEAWVRHHHFDRVQKPSKSKRGKKTRS
jgi:hypothetical protein